MRVGVTGTRDLDKTGRDNIVAALAALMGEGVEAIVVGGCVGADAWAGATAKRLGFWVKVILPENQKELDPAWESYADEADGPYPYRERNQRIVDEVTLMLAFPALPEQHPKSLRSGTWMTIRMAHRRAIPVRVFTQHTKPDWRPPRGVKGRRRQQALTPPSQPEPPKLPGPR